MYFFDVIYHLWLPKSEKALVLHMDHLAPCYPLVRSGPPAAAMDENTPEKAHTSGILEIETL